METTPRFLTSPKEMFAHLPSPGPLPGWSQLALGSSRFGIISKNQSSEREEGNIWKKETKERN